MKKQDKKKRILLKSMHKQPLKVAKKPVPLPQVKRGAVFAVRASEWSDALARTNKTRARRSTLPVLSNWLVQSNGTHVRITTSNLEMLSWVTIPARVVRSLDLTLHGSARDLAAYWMGDAVQVSYNAKSCTTLLAGQGQSVTVKGISAVEFPAHPRLDESKGFTLPRDLIRQIVARVALSAETNDVRPVLAGVLLQIESGTLTAVSADGFRMSILKSKLNAPDLSVILPATFFRLALDVLPVEFTDVILTIKDDRVQLTAEGCGVGCSLIPGNYPDFQKIAPGKGDMFVFPSARALAQAIAFVGVYARESLNSVTLALNPKAGQCVVSATSVDSGEGNQIVKMKKGKGRAVTMAFNRRYLLDGIRSAKDAAGTNPTDVAYPTSISLRVGSESSPIAFIAPNFMHVIMPMHVSGRTTRKIDPKEYAPEPVVKADDEDMNSASNDPAHGNDEEQPTQEAVQTLEELHEMAKERGDEELKEKFRDTVTEMALAEVQEVDAA